MAEATSGGGGRAGGVAAMAVIVAGLVVAVAAAAITVDHAQDEVYGIPGWGVTLVVVLAVLAVVGGAALLTSRQSRFGAVVLAASAFLAFGVLAIFSVGLLALLIGGGLLAWALSRPWPGKHKGRAAVGAALVGGALPLLVIVAAGGPVVNCGAQSSGSGENLFMALSPGAGEGGVNESSSTSGIDGDGGGSAKGEGYEYSYECRDGELVSFDLRWR